MKADKSKSSVKLRYKYLKTGFESLYLDINHNKKRTKEYLKLYINPIYVYKEQIKESRTTGKEITVFIKDETKKNRLSEEQRIHNKTVLETAEKIKAKRFLELTNNKYGFEQEYQMDASFIEYFESLMEDRKESKGNYNNWKATLKHLKLFKKGNISFKDVDAKFIKGFKKYIEFEAKTKSDNNLKTNTQSSYFNKFKVAVKTAYGDKLIPDNPIPMIRKGHSMREISIQPEETEIQYLTLSEIRKLVKVECSIPVLGRAFLFSCLSGMRWSDVESLIWSEVQEDSGSYKVVFRQVKTNRQEYLDIPVQALEYMGDRKEPNQKVFKGLKYSAWNNMQLQKWVMQAGISKTISFHCSRHSYAMLHLDEMNTDIYTLSKLLGHAEIKTTQIYAKVSAKKKKEAVNKTPNFNI